MSHPSVALVASIARTLEHHWGPVVHRLDDEFDFAALCAEAAAVGFGTGVDIPFDRRPIVVHRHVQAAMRLRSAVGEGGFDLVHVNTPIPAVLARLALPAATPLVYTVHGYHFHPHGSRLKNGVFRRLESLGRRRVRALVVMNAHDFSAARRMGFVPGDDLAMSPGVGIDLAQWHERPARTTVNPLRALVVGALTREKGVHLAVEAVTRVPGLRLDVVGTGPAEGELRRHIARRGVEARVRLLGRRNDVAHLMQQADLLLMPSLREGLPKVTLEAMASNLPVLASAIRGNEDLLGDSVGATFPPGDVDALTVALTRVVSDSGVLADWARGGRARSLAYDISAVAVGYRRLYQRVLAGDPVGDPWGLSPLAAPPVRPRSEVSERRVPRREKIRDG